MGKDNQEYEFDDLDKTPKQKITELLAEHKGLGYVDRIMERWCKEYDRYHGQPTPMLCTDNELAEINDEITDESNWYECYLCKKYGIPSYADIPGDADLAEKKYRGMLTEAREKDRNTAVGLRHARKMRILFQRREEGLERLKIARKSKKNQ